jgi:hypothetical protein
MEQHYKDYLRCIVLFLIIYELAVRLAWLHDMHTMLITFIRYSDLENQHAQLCQRVMLIFARNGLTNSRVMKSEYIC